MGNKMTFGPNNENFMIELLKATNGDIKRVEENKKHYIKDFQDFPRTCSKSLKKQHISEDDLDSDSRMQLMCRLLGYFFKKNLIYNKQKRNESDETKYIELDDEMPHIQEIEKITVNSSSDGRSELMNSPRFNLHDYKLVDRRSKKEEMIQKVEKVDWNILPIGILGLIFQSCNYSDFLSIINVCKKWRRVYFQMVQRKYEPISKLFSQTKNFSKVYSLQELIVTEKKNYTSYMAKDNMKSNKTYRVDAIKVDNTKKRFYKLMKKAFFFNYLDHPFFPKVVDVFSKSNNSFKVVTETKASVCLFDLNKLVRLEESDIAYVIKNILKGVQHAHSKDVILRSLSLNSIHVDVSGNILLMESKGAVFNKSETKLSSLQGYLDTASPEMLEGSYGFKSDIYSIGLICFYLLKRKLPSKKNMISSLFKIGLKLPYNFPEDRNETSVSFLSLLVEPEPSKRPSIEELLNHPFLSQEKSDSQSNLQGLVSQFIQPINFNKAIHNF